MVRVYKTGGFGRNWIEPMEAVKVTESRVYVGNSYEARHTQYHHYHDSWQAAKAHLVAAQRRRIEAYEGELEAARRRLAALEAIADTEPETAPASLPVSGELSL